jgi:hypothetical protein
MSHLCCDFKCGVVEAQINKTDGDARGRKQAPKPSGEDHQIPSQLQGKHLIVESKKKYYVL